MQYKFINKEGVEVKLNTLSQFIQFIEDREIVDGSMVYNYELKRWLKASEHDDYIVAKNLLSNNQNEKSTISTENVDINRRLSYSPNHKLIDNENDKSKSSTKAADISKQEKSHKSTVNNYNSETPKSIRFACVFLFIFSIAPVYLRITGKYEQSATMVTFLDNPNNLTFAAIFRELIGLNVFNILAIIYSLYCLLIKKNDSFRFVLWFALILIIISSANAIIPT